jgi:hypothetical protein
MSDTPTPRTDETTLRATNSKASSLTNCSLSFEDWWTDQENGCPTLVLDNDEQFARAVWDAATNRESAIMESKLKQLQDLLAKNTAIIWDYVEQVECERDELEDLLSRACAERDSLKAEASKQKPSLPLYSVQVNE